MDRQPFCNCTDTSGPRWVERALRMDGVGFDKHGKGLAVWRTQLWDGRKRYAGECVVTILDAILHNPSSSELTFLSKTGRDVSLPRRSVCGCCGFSYRNCTNQTFSREISSPKQFWRNKT